MQTNPEALLNELLTRWHRWSARQVRLPDTLMQDFDAMVMAVPAQLRIALQVQARNLACGAQVWNSPRLQPHDLAKARARLRSLLDAEADRWYGKRVVYLNERGNRIGESNPNAVLTDHEVELMLQLRDETNEDGTPKYSYAWLAEKFDVPRPTVQSICNGRRRNQVPARVKEVE